MSRTPDNWLLKVTGLTKIYGEPNENTLALTGPQFGSNICPETESIVACADINFELYPGEVLGIVGESGSGKSTVVKMLYFDIEKTYGEALLKPYANAGVNTLDESNQKKRYIRNHLMGMVYQNPRDGLNFNFTSGGNIAEKLIMAGNYHVGGIRERASELLVKTEVPVLRMDDRPSNFSGGMQQRVQISKAIANNPPLLFLDEVTTGLDVSVQAKVLDLIRELQHELGIAMIVVSHDLSVIRMLTDRTMVMKNGRIVESGLTDQILQDPQHAYSQLLVSSLL
ncbi:putative phosphonate transport system ATP-binding protein [Mucilaginibacter yixingensis]|uniref:Putative phosphonate transport system ATP-binding protein n=1 Tax=Mucilaginibacter yixingensis TaxID=1295612 RepID=A0A2T5J4R5_9SPHI|nr:ATP-binding cassette domain-containing protein [Mucilaginibacter yixingensis]PTQ92655.1 putative phosphonate transport system ATP-binding protein [Mucilaginibacter yixingensis]